jgi:hypothetical protein
MTLATIPEAATGAEAAMALEPLYRAEALTADQEARIKRAALRALENLAGRVAAGEAALPVPIPDPAHDQGPTPSELPPIPRHERGHGGFSPDVPPDPHTRTPPPGRGADDRNRGH